MKHLLLPLSFCTIIGTTNLYADSNAPLEANNLTTAIAVISKTPTHRAPLVAVAISAGELIDRITISQKGAEVFTGLAQIITQETLAHLIETQKASLIPSAELEMLTNKLSLINRTLWHYEVKIRQKIQAAEYDQEFIELTLLIYEQNKNRYLTKHDIDILCNSTLIEEKSDMELTINTPILKSIKQNTPLIFVKLDVADLLDKITILEKKHVTLLGPGKINAGKELYTLRTIQDAYINITPALQALITQLFEINSAGWDLEDASRSRMQELNGDSKALSTDLLFMNIAQQRRLNNDMRCSLKQKINKYCASLVTN